MRFRGANRPVSASASVARERRYDAAAMALEGVGRDTLVRDVLLNVAGAVAAFDRHRVDHCCHGALSLVDACARVGADVDAVLATLEEEAARPGAEAPRDREMLTIPLEALVAQLEGELHAGARADAKSLVAHARQVDATHPGRGLEAVVAALEALFAELLPHLDFEERHVFPYVVAMERASRDERPPPVALFETLAVPVADMTREHERTDHHLDALVACTNGYRPAPEDDDAVRALFAALAAHHEGLVRHMHLEGNVLFPRAERLEAKLAEGRRVARRR